jgi:hypothetical protein
MKSLNAIWKTADELRLSTQQQCSRHKNVKGPAELSSAGPFKRFQLLEVKPIIVHDFGPCLHEIANEFAGVVVLCVHLCQ